MKLTARISSLLTALLSLACFAGAYRAFRSLGGMVDPVQLRDTRGFGWFAVFLGLVFLAIAGLGWWLLGQREPEA